MTNTIIVAIAVALIYVFIIKPRQDKKAAEAKKNQADAIASSEKETHSVMQNEPLAKKERKEEIKANADPSAPDLATTKTVVWMAHCINLPFLPQDKNMRINMELMPMLSDFENAVKAGDHDTTIMIYNKFQDKVKEKFGSARSIPMDVLKFCSLSKDLLDVYKMVIEGQKNEDVLSGKGAIRRILKYSIELGSPAKTLDALTDYFVHHTWFDAMPEEDEWLKLALECTMVSGNGELGQEILGRLEKQGGLEDETKEELLDHAREYRSQIDASWM